MKMSYLIALLVFVSVLASRAIAQPIASVAPPAGHDCGAGHLLCLTPSPSERGLFTSTTWPFGTVYYTFTGISQAEQQRMLAAWATLSANANVRFLPRLFEPNYIDVLYSTVFDASFSSAVGMPGGRQTLQIWPSHFNRPGILMHETMHALGLYHEIQRADRNQFITVNLAAVDPAFLGNYTIINATRDGVYDFASLMHYNEVGFGLANARTVTVNEPYRRRWQWAIGQFGRVDAILSTGDRSVLSRMYPGPIMPPPKYFRLVSPAMGEAVGKAWIPAFAWESSETATSYRLQVDDAPTFASPEIDVVLTGTSYTHPEPLPAQRLFWWRVIASNAQGTTHAYPLESQTVYTASDYPVTLYVDDSAPSSGHGTSWADALSDLGVATETAYASAGTVTEIRVAQGNYTPAFGSADRGHSFWISNACALLGGFAGVDAPDPDARDIDLYQTVLSGDLNHDDLPGFANIGDNSLTVVSSLFSGPSTLVEGFTIRGGRSETILLPGFGGGMVLDGGTLTVRRCRFTSNHADDGGGAMTLLFSEADPVIDQCVFDANRALGPGPTSFVTLGGGAIHAHQCGGRFTSCLFTNNAGLAGGAVFTFAAHLSFTNCLFSANAATASSAMWIGGGALISVNGSAPSLLNCTLVNNSSPVSGGAIKKDATGSSLVSNSILWGNTPNQISGTPQVRYSDIQGGFGGLGNISAAPIFVNSLAGDYTLGAHSPGIDAGSNALIPPAIVTDFVGQPRFVDDPFTPDTGAADPARPALSRVDMGAFEFQGNSCAADINNDGILSSQDFFDFVSHFFNGGDPQADFNHDGETTSQDFFDFLAAFFTGC